MTQAVVEQEAKAAGMSIHDILKRRIWLGPSEERLNATCEVEQAGDLNRVDSRASNRRRRVQRNHQMLFSLRRFSQEHEIPDVCFWRPQHVSLKQDSRFPLQGCLLPVDPASWLRWNTLRDGPPQLTVAQLPPLLPITTPPTPMTRPQEAAPGAMSSSDPRSLPGALPKSHASPLFAMQMHSKARPPVNPIADPNATEDGTAASSRSPTPLSTPAITWTPPRGGARSRSRTPRRTRSPRAEASAAAITWTPPHDGPRCRSRSPRRPAPTMWVADEESTAPRRSPSMSSSEL